MKSFGAIFCCCCYFFFRRCIFILKTLTHKIILINKEKLHYVSDSIMYLTSFRKILGIQMLSISQLVPFHIGSSFFLISHSSLRSREAQPFSGSQQFTNQKGSIQLLYTCCLPCSLLSELQLHCSPFSPPRHPLR